MNKSRLRLVEETISLCLNRDVAKPDLCMKFWNFEKTKFFDVEIHKSHISVGYQQRPGGGEVNLLIINKSVRAIAEDIKNQSHKITPDVIVVLENDEYKKGLITLEMGPERGQHINMLTFRPRFEEILISIQTTLYRLVYTENLNRKKTKRKDKK